MDSDGALCKEEWKVAFEQAGSAPQAMGMAALDLAGAIDMLKIVHTRPADADFAQLCHWKSLVATCGTNKCNKLCLLLCSNFG